MSLSIITVHLNDFPGLEKTFLSLQQHLPGTQVEWIVVDGGSFIEDNKNKQLLDTVKTASHVFISEPDSGIYNAMNKGACLATRQYMLFLNAGDILHPDFNLSSILKNLGDTQPEMIWGSFGESGKSNSLQYVQPKKEKWIWWGMPTSHQAILFKRDALEKQVYDETLKIAGDYDLVLKMETQGATVFSTASPISIVDGTGVSNVKKSAALSEQMLVRKQYLGTPYVLNILISLAHLTSSAMGRIKFLRALWK